MNRDDGCGKLDAVIARRSRLENLAKGKIHGCNKPQDDLILATRRVVEDKASRLDAIKSDILQQYDTGCYTRVLQPSRAVPAVHSIQDIVDLYAAAAEHSNGTLDQRLLAPPPQPSGTAPDDDILVRWRQQRAKTALRASVLQQQQPAHNKTLSSSKHTATPIQTTSPCATHASTQTDPPCFSNVCTQTQQPTCSTARATQTNQPSRHSVGTDCCAFPTPPHAATSPTRDASSVCVQNTWLHDAALGAQAAAFAAHLVVHMAGVCAGWPGWDRGRGGAQIKQESHNGGVLKCTTPVTPQGGVQSSSSGHAHRDATGYVCVVCASWHDVHDVQDVSLCTGQCTVRYMHCSTTQWSMCCLERGIMVLGDVGCTCICA